MRHGGLRATRIPPVELPNAECVDALGTCWESSGIIDASVGPGFGFQRSRWVAAIAPPRPRTTPASTSLTWCTRSATRE